MRRARVFVQDRFAGWLAEEEGGGYVFRYVAGYDGPPVSLTMPVREAPYRDEQFPAFFDGLLPEGVMLEALLRRRKLDRSDYMGQLLAVGEDVVGAVSVLPAEDIQQGEEGGA